MVSSLFHTAAFVSTATVAAASVMMGVSSFTVGTTTTQQLSLKRIRTETNHEQQGLCSQDSTFDNVLSLTVRRVRNARQRQRFRRHKVELYDNNNSKGNNGDYQLPNFDADEIANYDPSLMSQDIDGSDDNESEITSYVQEEINYIRNELIHLESLEELIQELEQYNENDFYNMDYGEDDEFNSDEDIDIDMDDDNDDDIMSLWDDQSLDELLNNLPLENVGNDRQLQQSTSSSSSTNNSNNSSKLFYQNLEQVLMQGVVPVSAGVGSEGLVGDFGFDPLSLSNVDLILPTQQFLLQLLVPKKTIPTSSSNQQQISEESDANIRPKALILRDYREAEIRHGRLAMLAAMIWPVQEMVDKFILSEDQFGPLLYGPVTLPYFPLLMTAIMLLLGYLDIYSQAIKDMDQIGDAFLPGDCFWDPLQILEGADNTVKRNMQERELFNGRAAMIAIGAYIVEESLTRKAIVDIGSNALLLQPAYEIPFIQRWLDEQFTSSTIDPALIPNDNDWLIDSLDVLIQTTFLIIH